MLAGIIPKSGESLQQRMEKPSLLQADFDDWQSLLALLGAKCRVCFPCEKSKKNVCVVKAEWMIFFAKILWNLRNQKNKLLIKKEKEALKSIFDVYEMNFKNKWSVFFVGEIKFNM